MELSGESRRGNSCADEQRYALKLLDQIPSLVGRVDGLQIQVDKMEVGLVSVVSDIEKLQTIPADIDNINSKIDENTQAFETWVKAPLTKALIIYVKYSVTAIILWIVGTGFVKSGAGEFLSKLIIALVKGIK